MKIKPQIEKHLKKARQELEVINEQINVYEKQIAHLKNLTQAQLNNFIAKQGGIVELENMLAQLAIQEDEKKASGKLVPTPSQKEPVKKIIKNK